MASTRPAYLENGLGLLTYDAKLLLTSKFRTPGPGAPRNSKCPPTNVLCLALDFEMPTYFMTDVLLVCNFLKQKVFLGRSEFHFYLRAFCHIIAKMGIVFSSSQALCTVVWAFGSEYTTQQLSNFPTASRHKTEWYLCLLPLFTPASGDLLLAV